MYKIFYIWFNGQLRQCIGRELLLKGEQLSFGEQAKSGERWITVHPHGKDHPGVPVLVRESQTHPGTYHVISGGGGKMGLLRLTDLKSEKEYKDIAKKRAREKKEKKAKERQREKEHYDTLTPEQKKAHSKQKTAIRAKKKAKKEDVAKQHDERRRQAWDVASDTMGWDKNEIDFTKQREGLAKKGYTPKEIDRLEKNHARAIDKKMSEMEDALKTEAIKDSDFREKMGLSDVSEDDFGVDDLLDTTFSGSSGHGGLGEEAERQINKTVFDQGVEEAQEALEEADTDQEKTQAQAELEAAEAMQRGADKTVEEIQEELSGVDKELLDAVNKRTEARNKALAARKNGEVSPEVENAVKEAEDAVAEALKKQRNIDLQMAPHEALIDTEARAVKEEVKKKRSPEAQARIDAMQEKAKDARAKAKHAIESGHALMPEGEVSLKEISPADAMKALKALKLMKASQRALRKANGEIDKSSDGAVYPAMVIEASEVDAATEEALKEEIETDLRRSFLNEVEKAGAISTDPDTARKLIQYHLSTGNYNAIQDASFALFGNSAMAREAVDVLGIAGAAEVMAFLLHKEHGADVAAQMAEAVGQHHADTQKAHMEATMAKAQELYTLAGEVEIQQAEGPKDLETAMVLNDERKGHLQEAAQLLGTSLGELEANAALHVALQRAPRDKFEVSLGSISPEVAVKQARALGLGAGDYEIHSDGKNQFLTVKSSGYGKMVTPLDKKEVQFNQEVRAIKEGRRDEKGWLPEGFARRETVDLTPFSGKPDQQAVSLTEAHGKHDGDWEKAIHEYIGSHLHDGWSPEEINDGLKTGEASSIRRTDYQGWTEAMDKILPSRDDQGERRLGHSYIDEMRPIADKWAKDTLDIDKAGVNGQALRLDNPEDAKQTMDALHHALSENSFGRYAFTDEHEQDSKSTRAFREYYEQHIAPGQKITPDDKKEHKSRLKQWKKDNPQPEYSEREGSLLGAGSGAASKAPEVDMFGDPIVQEEKKEPLALQDYNAQEASHSLAVSDAEHRYIEATKANNQKPSDENKTFMEKAKADMGAAQAAIGQFRQDNAKPLESQAHQKWMRDVIEADGAISKEVYGGKSLSWGDYAGVHTNAKDAYKSVQDVMRGHFLDKFKEKYESIHKAPLKEEQRTIRNDTRHEGALDPEVQAERRKLQLEIDAGVKDRRSNGTFDRGEAGYIVERREKRLQKDKAEKAQTATLFGEMEEAGSIEGKKGDKYIAGKKAWNNTTSLGDQVESQLATMVNKIGHGYNPRQKVKLIAPRMEKIEGVKHPLHLQQRAVKFGSHTKRCGIHGGTGSGKTAIAFGVFSEAYTKGEIKRAVFAVPSAVKGQFGTEAAAFLEPGKFKWHADLSGDKKGRMAAYGDSETHMMVVTHQGFRDDAMGFLGHHWGTDGPATKEKMMAMDPSDLAPELHTAFEKKGAKDLLDGFFMDEGHHSLNRAGKKDSSFAKIVDAISRHAHENDKYFVSATGTPVKNDVSEIFDELRKVAPHKFTNMSGFMRKYGAGTDASNRALKRVMDQHFYSFEVPSGTDPIRVVSGETPGHPALKMSDWQKGKTDNIVKDYEAAQRALRRGEFDHDATARLVGKDKLSDEDKTRYGQGFALASLRDARHRDVIDAAPIEHNVKAQEVVKQAKEFRKEKRGGVVFVRSNKARPMIKEALEREGFKVGVIDGSQSSFEKSMSKEAFITGKHNIILCSNAANAGISLHEGEDPRQGSWMTIFDTPKTYSDQKQRLARIDRLGQKWERPNLTELVTDHPMEQADRERLHTKKRLHDMEMSNEDQPLDDSGLAGAINGAWDHVRHNNPLHGLDNAA